MVKRCLYLLQSLEYYAGSEAAEDSVFKINYSFYPRIV